MDHLWILRYYVTISHSYIDDSAIIIGQLLSPADCCVI